MLKEGEERKNPLEQIETGFQGGPAQGQPAFWNSSFSQGKSNKKAHCHQQLVFMLQQQQKLIEVVLEANKQKIGIIQELKGELTFVKQRLILSHEQNQGRCRTTEQLILRLKRPLPSPIYKGCNFDIYLEVSYQGGLQVPDYLQLSLQLYTSSSCETLIEQNLKGLPVLHYSPESRIVGSQGVLRKVRINQVSSKFKRGSVTLCIRAENPVVVSNQAPAFQVRPLLISDLKVYSRPSKK